jgi:NAD(P)-dependent dehydrogenase (short-subunit alcohol dehydrogenase family)
LYYEFTKKIAMNKVWFITGCSTGFGRELSKLVLSLGYKAAIASRNIDDVKDIIASYPETAFAVKLDVTKADEIVSSVNSIMEKFGQIDVLVNNAGIGYFGAAEESEEKEVRNMFEVNFFGLVNLTNQVLPIMRKQKSGHIVNIASIAGFFAFPALSFYNATKFAVVGYSESLAKETAHLGIKITIIAPSGFRTDWAGRSAKESPIEIEDYAPTAGANRINLRKASGHQPGDPTKGAAAIVKAVESKNPPLHLLLGVAALKNARIKLAELKNDFDSWEETTVGADAPL